MLCLNVLEYLDDPGQLLESLAPTIRPGGSLVVLVPNVPGIYGSLDRKMGHKRRYTQETIGQLLAEHGFAMETVDSFNKVALLPWWAYSKLLGSGSISKLVLKIFDKSVWFWRRLDVLMPWPGLSLVAVGRKPARPDASVPSTVYRETTRNAN